MEPMDIPEPPEATLDDVLAFLNYFEEGGHPNAPYLDEPYEPYEPYDCDQIED